MIRAVILFGWLGVAVYVAAGIGGYGASVIGDEIDGHLLVALLASSTLLFVYLCVLIYVNGAARLVARTVGAESLDPEWRLRYQRLRGRANLWLGAAGGLVVASFATGVLVHVGRSEPIAHHVLFYLGLPAHAAALVVLGRALKRGEAHLASLDAHLRDRATPGRATPAGPSPSTS